MACCPRGRETFGADALPLRVLLRVRLETLLCEVDETLVREAWRGAFLVRAEASEAHNRRMQSRLKMRKRLKDCNKHLDNWTGYRWAAVRIVPSTLRFRAGLMNVAPPLLQGRVLYAIRLISAVLRRATLKADTKKKIAPRHLSYMGELIRL